MAHCDAGIQIPDPYQRAIRLSCSVLFACLIGYGIILPDQGIHVTHKKEFSNGLKWSAITCIVVNAPVIGRVAQTGTERIAGTVAGGWLGYGVFTIGSMYWTTWSDGVVLSIAAAVVAFSSVIIGWKFNLNDTTKLYALTFMLVTFGSENLASQKGALLLTLTRISGICFGVLLSELTSVLVFPKSATQEALLHLRTALKKLTDLNAMAWQHGPLFRPEWQSMISANGKPGGGEEYLPMGGHVHMEEEWLKDAEVREKRFEEECERVLMDTYNSLYKVQDFLPQARSEIYMGHLGQQLCFLPGIPWLQVGRRTLPEPLVQELATCIRRVARLLWAVHLSFQQGFDENMLEMLRQQYPARLLPELAQQTQGCLQDMLETFPNAPAVPGGHLRSLVSAVESLLRISDYQRRRVLHHMKHTRPASKRSRSKHRPSSGSPTSPRIITSPVPPALGDSTSQSATRLRPPAASQVQPRMNSAAVAQQPPRDYALGRSKSKRYEGAGPQSSSLQGSPGPPTLAVMASNTPGSDADAQLPASKRRNENSLTQPLLIDGAAKSCLVHEYAASESAQNSYQPPSQNPSGSVVRVSPFAAHASTSNMFYHGSPNDAFKNLPEGLQIEVGSPASGDPCHSYVVDMGTDEDARTVNVRLQRVESGDLIVFPETAEGYVDKVRWYSFQFLMEELTEEIEAMHDVMGELLQKLPHPCLSL